MSLEDEGKFYGDAKKYWEGITPTVDGMLGGFAKISPTDINGSHAFLRPFLLVSFRNILKTHTCTIKARVIHFLEHVSDIALFVKVFRIKRHLRVNVSKHIMAGNIKLLENP